MLQRDVAIMRAFAPLPRVMNPAVPTTGYDDVKRIALARIIVDNVPSIQVDWSLLRAEARAGRAHGGRRRRGRRVGGGRDDGGQTTGAARRDPPQHPRGGQEPVERNGRFEAIDRRRRRVRDERRGARAPGRGRIPERASARRTGSIAPRGSTLRYDVPSRCAALLHERAIDVGLIPSIEYLRGGPLSHRPRPGDCIARGGGVGGDLYHQADERRPLDRHGHELADVGRAREGPVQARSTGSIRRLEAAGPIWRRCCAVPTPH